MPEDLSPADEARLRRLLARSRHDEPVPEEVVRRLDDVLARLGAEQPHDDLDGYAAAAASASSTTTPPPVDPSTAPATRRHHRRITLLAAAAAVVVAGIGVDQVLDRSGSERVAASTSADEGPVAALADPTEGRGSDDDLAAAMAEPEAEAFALDGSAAGGSGESPQEAGDGVADTMVLTTGDLLVVRGELVGVRERSFADVAARLQRLLGTGGGGSARTVGIGALRDADPRVQRAWQGCTPTQAGAGTAVAVLYDGEPAVLVLRPVEGSTQVAALLQCGTGKVLRSVTLPVG